MFRALLDWAEESGWQGGSLIVYELADGHYRFSQTTLLQTIQQIAEEAGLSDRLLLVICAAHLEDQVRTLLARFLIDDKLVEDMFERTAVSFMCNLAFSLGLIASEWHEILKSISLLRNAFAHRPEMRSFDVLLASDPKSKHALAKLITWLRDHKHEDVEVPRDVVTNAVLELMPLLQFAIDHVAEPDRRTRLDPALLAGNTLLMGYSREMVESRLNEDWVSLSGRIGDKE